MDSSRVAVMGLMQKFLTCWETGRVSTLEGMILPDAFIDFTIFGRGISIAALKKMLSDRQRKTDFIRFYTFNNVCRVKDDQIQQSLAVIGFFADPNDGEWTQCGIEGTFVNSYRKVDGEWKFSAIRFELTDENMTAWQRFITDGLHTEMNQGDTSFVSNWPNHLHDDRIGWYANSRLPAIVGEFDAPWYAIPQTDEVGTEEEQVQEVFFRYAFGIDFNTFKLYDDVFTEDAMIMYGDTRPFTKRSVTDFLKFERQGSCRCVHTGFFKSVEINGDTAVGYLYLRDTYIPEYFCLDDKLLSKPVVWSRYRLEFLKEDGQWRIRRLVFYKGHSVVDMENVPVYADRLLSISNLR